MLPSAELRSGVRSKAMNIGEPKRVIEVVPTSLPLPELAPPQSEPIPAGEPARAPEPSQPGP